jgi:hypothetical protein
MSTSNIIYLNHEKHLVSFISSQTMQNQRQRVIGRILKNKLTLLVEGSGDIFKKTVQIPSGVHFGETVSFSLADELIVGKSFTIPVYLSTLRIIEELAVRILEKTIKKNFGESYEVFVVETTIHGIKTIKYITPDGMELFEDGPLGFSAIKTTEENALKLAKLHVPIQSLIAFSLVKPDKPLNDPISISELQLAITGIDGYDDIPSDYRQTLIAASSTPKKSAPVVLRRFKPSVASYQLGTAVKVDKESLAATPEIQSQNGTIKKLAADIIEGETDAWSAAKKINRWVYSNIEKKLVDSFSALDVLKSRKGECQSHTNLFAALARSAGIPTQVSVGLVYSPQHKGFLYHSWPSVYIGEWVAMDPTLGQDVADATHIKLASGEPGNQLNLLRLIGKISISIQSIIR